MVRTSGERYEVMRRNVPLPTNIESLGEYEQLDFYQVDVLPDTWLFDHQGDWIGWRR